MEPQEAATAELWTPKNAQNNLSCKTVQTNLSSERGLGDPKLHSKNLTASFWPGT